MKKCFGYIRVSTVKQGEHGVSLQEQRDAILRYAQRNGLDIEAWFEERETAAKRGRPVFNQMLKLLRHRKADGVIIHKIDRGARNLKDWSDFSELVDRGIELHCANESLDLTSRGGRLSADIQAVVAADYIRNLREETRKGFYGRIKQGVYPLPAPIGYLDRGKGQPKEPDPMKAPLVKKAFELYATGRYCLKTLQKEITRLGLRNGRGKPLTLNGLSVLLNNPFYLGLIRLKRTGETFPGAHPPLISKSLFDRVRLVLSGKLNARTQRHDFLFRHLLRCGYCGYSLIGERQKGHVYYRCHTRECPTTGVREETAEETIEEHLDPLQFGDDEKDYLRSKVAQLKDHSVKEREAHLVALRMRLAQLHDRLARLTDAYIDRVIDKEVYEERKTAILMERNEIEEQLAQPADTLPNRVAEFLELASTAYLAYKLGLPEERRDLVSIVTSNRIIEGKNIDISLALPFREVANRWENANSPPARNRTSI